MENFLLSSQNGYDTNAIAKLFASDIKLIKCLLKKTLPTPQQRGFLGSQKPNT